MGWLKNIYKKNIYGVMGTLIFHILLVMSFMMADIDLKGKMKEEPIVIEFPDLPPEPEIPQEETSNETQIPGSENAKLTTNRASNISAANEDKFFDEDYRRELAEAQKLVNDVNKQLKTETIDIENIKMPVETTEGLDPEEVKKKVYSGESNITYDLKDRYHLRLPVPVYLAQGGGSVTVDITVDRRGNVVKYSAQRNSKIADEQLYYYAELAASRTVFNADSSAPAQQKGTITYRFIPQ